ncbi:MAG: hypothetical protein JRI75_05535 [Deltaproteobacteria bacterium]|nr:hypothetical protein [Deltaproteobacteria bacterium]
MKNHLEAEPGQKQTQEKEKDPIKKDVPLDDEEARFTKLRLEHLHADNQVMRALEILVSHKLFKDIST